MESLKKVITLNQAAKMSGYNQDYLGSLIRQGDIKGKKVGRNWFTTEEEIKNYIFKQKVRHDQYAISDFLSSRRRLTNIVAIAATLLVGGFLGFYLLTAKSELPPVEARHDLSEDIELVQ